MIYQFAYQCIVIVIIIVCDMWHEHWTLVSSLMFIGCEIDLKFNNNNWIVPSSINQKCFIASHQWWYVDCERDFDMLHSISAQDLHPHTNKKKSPSLTADSWWCYNNDLFPFLCLISLGIVALFFFSLYCMITNDA